jgi:hypothetical protein
MTLLVVNRPADAATCTMTAQDTTASPVIATGNFLN